MFNRNLLLILLTNVVLGSPMPMLIILGGLAGASLAPVPILITLPVSIQLMAGILFATPLSLFMGRWGRQRGFLLVAALMSVGGSMAVLALQMSEFWLLCVAHLVMGAALVGVNFLRFAAAEVVPQASRPNAISFTLASGIVAAFLGPSLFEHSRSLIQGVPFAGAYAAIAVLGLLGAMPVLSMSLSDSLPGTRKTSRSAEHLWHVIRHRADVRLAIGIAAVSQAIMVLMMVPTPLAIVAVGFDHDLAANVIRWHVVAMFAPGIFTGSLIIHVGVHRVIFAGLTLLLLAALVAVAGTTSMHFHVALILLGVGWNFGFVGGTHLLQRATLAHEKASIQGGNDTLLAIASVCASVLAGVLYSETGWLAIAMIVVPVMLLALFWLLMQQRRSQTDTA